MRLLRNGAVLALVVLGVALGEASSGEAGEAAPTSLLRGSPRPPPAALVGAEPPRARLVNGVGATELLSRPELAAYVALAMQQLALGGSAEALPVQLPAVLSPPRQ